MDYFCDLLAPFSCLVCYYNFPFAAIFHRATQLGAFDPIPNRHGMKTVRLDFDRVKYWLSIGAQPSDPVSYLLALANVLPPKPYVPM
jgi:hypothetical protein